MRITTLLMAGMIGAAIALTAGTAGAAPKGGRDAAMTKCLAEARASAENLPEAGAAERRTAIYKDCMAKAGYRP